jgi:hypothetical protein
MVNLVFWEVIMQMNSAPLDSGIVSVIAIAFGVFVLVAQFTLKLSLPEAPQPGQVANMTTQAPQPDAYKGGKG